MAHLEYAAALRRLRLGAADIERAGSGRGGTELDQVFLPRRMLRVLGTEGQR
jgi:hypothetical protein